MSSLRVMGKPLEEWSEKFFDDLIESKAIGLVKSAKEQDHSFEFDYVKMHNISNDNSWFPEKVSRVNATELELEKFSLQKDDLLFNTRNSFELVGKSCMYQPISDRAAVFNNNIMRIRFQPEINQKFAAYAFCSNQVLDQLEKMKQGTTNVSAIYYKTLKGLRLKFPSIPEQKRIVALLDTVFAELEQTRAKTEQNLKNARELFDSYLQQVFSQKGEGWEEKKWGDVCKFIRGPFGGSLKKSMFKSEGYAVYEQKHAIHDHIEQLRYYVDEDKFEEMKRFELKPGELIMSCSGVTLGRASVIPEDAPKGIINQALLKLTANDDLDIHFLKYWIRCKIFQDIIFEHAGGAAIPNVPAAKILKEIKLQIPTFEKQKIIVLEIDSMVSKRDSLLRVYTEKLAALDELKKSILQKAFSGELTTNKNIGSS